MKKTLGILLAFILCFSLCACNAEQAPENTPPADSVENALIYLNEGKHAEAYDMLSRLSDNKQAQTLLSRFVLLPASASANGKAAAVFKVKDGASVFTFPFENENATGETLYYSYTFSKDGKTIAEVNHRDGNGLSTAPITLVYDDDCLLIRRVRKDGKTVETITYDENGRITQDADGSYTYDEQGNLIKAVRNGAEYLYTYTADNRLYTTTIDGVMAESFVFDDSGRPIRRDQFDEEGNVISSHSYEYDDAGNYTITDDITVYRYSADGVLLSQISSLHGGNTYTYDENGQLSAVDTVDDEGNQVRSFAYTYDADGNLVKAVRTEGNAVTTYTYSDFGMYYMPNEVVVEALQSCLHLYY